MHHFRHHNILEEIASVNDVYSFEQLRKQIFYLASALSHTQAHCKHLEAVLRANNISMPDNQLDTQEHLS